MIRIVCVKMKRLVIVTLICLIINITNSFTFIEEESYEYPNEDDEDEKGTIYDLKDAPKLFEKFIKDYNKVYKNEEDRDMHYKTFVSNLKYINEVNSEGKSFTVDINLFSDMKEEELGSFQ